VLFKSPGVRETLLRRSSVGGGSTHVRTIVEALDENSTSSPDLSGVRSIKNDTSGASMKMLFKGVEGSGIKRRDRSHDDSSCSDLERIRESMERLKI